MSDTIDEMGSLIPGSELHKRLEAAAKAIVAICQQYDVEFFGATLLSWDRDTNYKGSVSICRIPKPKAVVPVKELLTFYETNLTLLVKMTAEALATKAGMSVADHMTAAEERQQPSVNVPPASA